MNRPKRYRNFVLLICILANSFLFILTSESNNLNKGSTIITTTQSSNNQSNNAYLPPMPSLDDMYNFDTLKSVELIKNIPNRTIRSSFFSSKSTESGKANPDQLLINSMNEFTLKLLNYLMNKYSNIVISPISLYSSLIALHAASSGTTEAQLTKLLGLTGISEKQIATGYRNILDSLNLSLSDEQIELNLINEMLVDEKMNISASYKDKVKKYYNMNIQPVDFATKSEFVFQYINRKVDSVTNGMIKNIMDERPDPLSKLLLVNAINFKGKWAKSFNPKDTTLMKFKNKDIAPTKVRMMKMVNEFQVHCDSLRQKRSNPPLCAIKIPYYGDQITMHIIQSSNNKSSLKDAVERRMSNQFLQELETKYSTKMVELGLPSFKLEDTHELREPMDFLGANSMFTKDRANLNKFLTRSSSSSNDGQDAKEDLFVNKFRHKATIEVNEEGTVASGATSVLIGNRSGTHKLYVDKPFIFLIKDQLSGAILFLGRINNLE